MSNKEPRPARLFSRAGFDLPELGSAIQTAVEETWDTYEKTGDASEKAKHEHFARVVRLLGLHGHESGLDLALAEKQFQDERELLSRYESVWGAAEEAYRAIGYRPWHFPDIPAIREDWRAFTEGRLCLRVIVPELGFYGGVTWDELRPHVDGAPEDWEEFADREIEVEANWLSSHLFQSEETMAEWKRSLALKPEERRQSRDTRIPLLMEAGVAYDFAEAVIGALAQKGLFRGPCQSCGLPRWPVPWREPRKGGRPPLDWTRCPACATASRRAASTGAQRRWRNKKPGQQSTKQLTPTSANLDHLSPPSASVDSKPFQY